MPVLTGARGPRPSLRSGPGPADVVLLGLGQVGSAVAELAAATAIGKRLTITRALVRDPSRSRVPKLTLLHHPSDVWDSPPDVVVELLGGLEPARSCVRDALARGIPVVTANKTLLAHHGDELLSLARRTGAPLRYEASVLAGVPFLGTLARRPLARNVTRLTAILNGTSHYVLTRIDRQRERFASALDEARRLGFAEPDPAKDVDGRDAAEKLTILIRLLAGRSVHPDAIPRTGIDTVGATDCERAREFGGVVKPVVFADWSAGEVTAFVSPAFVPARHPLAALDGVENGLYLSRPGHVAVGFSGPGAGPHVTAATVLDDVVEILDGRTGPVEPQAAGRATVTSAGERPWFLRLGFETDSPDERELADLLASFDVWIERMTRPFRSSKDVALLTYPVDSERLDDALRALASATACTARRFPALEIAHV